MDAEQPDPRTRAARQALVRQIHRPQRALLTYYALSSLLFGPLFPFLFIPRFFRYETLRYEFGDEGISMRWGILFRREIHLTYARIQDIHLRSNVVERWLGLARLLIQTASGSSGAEMTLEGIPEFEELRDFIYEKMRGGGAPELARSALPDEAGAEPPHGRELARLLEEVAHELREIRGVLERERSR